MSNPLLSNERRDEALPMSARRQEVLTVTDTIHATTTLVFALTVGAVVGWFATTGSTGAVADAVGAIPVAAMPVAVLAVGFGIAAGLRPQRAAVFGTAYALTQGFVVGAVSRAHSGRSDGAVPAALSSTVAVLAIMLALYPKAVIRPSKQFRSAVVSATLGLLGFWTVVGSLVATGLVPSSFVESSTVLVSALGAAVAAGWLILDFQSLDQHIAAGSPRHIRWLVATGFVVTLAWIYLELLRLIAQAAGGQ